MKLKKLLSLLLLTIAVSVSSCTLAVAPVQVPVPLPARPELRVCPENPHVEGEVRDGKVILTFEDAVRQRRYTEDLEHCMLINKTILEGHIEKLENRLRAVGGE